jgi:hypothetical protein
MSPIISNLFLENSRRKKKTHALFTTTKTKLRNFKEQLKMQNLLHSTLLEFTRKTKGRIFAMVKKTKINSAYTWKE